MNYVITLVEQGGQGKAGRPLPLLLSVSPGIGKSDLFW